MVNGLLQSMHIVDAIPTSEQKKQDNNCEEEIIVAPASESISIEKSKVVAHVTYYDVSIVYDPYYQTPHVYFSGYRDVCMEKKINSRMECICRRRI